jgi:hypothetical protein
MFLTDLNRLKNIGQKALYMCVKHFGRSVYETKLRAAKCNFPHSIVNSY